jgi:hypothetical protein
MVCIIIYISVCRKTFIYIAIFTLSVKDEMFSLLEMFYVTTKLGRLRILSS